MDRTVPTQPTETREDLLANLDDSLFRLVWRYGNEAAQAFAPLGLNPLRVVVLGLIDRETMHPKDLVETLTAAPPSVSHLLRDLEQRGLVHRTHDVADRRRIQLSLTEAGREVLEDLRDRWHQVSAARFARLEDHDLRALLRIHDVLLEVP